MKTSIFALIIGAILPISNLYACSCAEWTNGSQMIKDADAAYLVVPSEDSKVDPSIPTDPEMGNIKTMKTGMKVIRKFKGKYSKFFYLFTEEGDGANCGVNFKKNDGVYLVFAYKQNGKYFSGMCDLSIVHPELTEVTSILSEL